MDMHMPGGRPSFHLRHRRTASALLTQENAIPNVRKTGIRHSFLGDLYHQMLAMRWTTFIAFMAGIYLALNLFFGTAYFILAPGGISNITGNRAAGDFFFSVQTLSTVGYGTASPIGWVANSIMTVEEFSGMMFTAVATGLVFARFSRPTAWVRFSRDVVMWEEHGMKRLALRIGNLRSTALIDVTAVIVLARTVTDPSGKKGLEVENLMLEHAHVPLLNICLPIIHDVTPESPLYGLTMKDLQAQDAEFIVTLSATDEVSAQTVFACHTYKPGSLRDGYVFKDILRPGPGGHIVADFRLFDMLVPVEEAKAAKTQKARATILPDSDQDARDFNAGAELARESLEPTQLEAPQAGTPSTVHPEALPSERSGQDSTSSDLSHPEAEA
ncbi:ATP-sensitive potassium channel protein [Formicincola oecophyllae]|uniref:ATP-sensitive potassium channel protein n=1 Tax=Formicincola oecophyllae TaxID=2558361 RepID=A0A4Y6UA82_9PROT|nr:ion channel [Formicincola oecophyllae]QDH13860.1 ATP-sensitive potassium channel protein [Formicincola oecophyllae]